MQTVHSVFPNTPEIFLLKHIRAVNGLCSFSDQQKCLQVRVTVNWIRLIETLSRNAVGASGKEPYYFVLNSNLLPSIQSIVSLSTCVMENSYVDAF